jgi:hypothetical protein
LRRLDAISILTLILSTGTLVITAIGAGSVKSADDMSPSLPLSSPIVVDMDGEEVGVLKDLVDEGVVGVMIVGTDSTSNNKTQNH